MFLKPTLLVKPVWGAGLKPAPSLLLCSTEELCSLYTGRKLANGFYLHAPTQRKQISPECPLRIGKGISHQEERVSEAASTLTDTSSLALGFSSLYRLTMARISFPVCSDHPPGTFNSLQREKELR